MHPAAAAAGPPHAALSAPAAAASGGPQAGRVDVFDNPDFNPIRLVNQLYPDESLEGLDVLVEALKAQARGGGGTGSNGSGAERRMHERAAAQPARACPPTPTPQLAHAGSQCRQGDLPGSAHAGRRARACQVRAAAGRGARGACLSCACAWGRVPCAHAGQPQEVEAPWHASSAGAALGACRAAAHALQSTRMLRPRCPHAHAGRSWSTARARYRSCLSA